MRSCCTGEVGCSRLTLICTDRTVQFMSSIRYKGAEEARNELPSLVEDAEKGDVTIITRRGRPVAALMPVATVGQGRLQLPLTALAGTGRGVWGRESTRGLRKLRVEWDR